MRDVVVLLVLVVAMHMEVESRRTAEQDFWSGYSVDPHPGAIQDMPGNEVLPADRIQVTSSAIRILPRPLRIRSRRSHRPEIHEHYPALKEQTARPYKATKNYKKKQPQEHSGRGKDLKQMHEHSEHGKDLKQMHEHSEHGKDLKQMNVHSEHGKDLKQIHEHSEHGKDLKQMHDHSEHGKDLKQKHEHSEHGKNLKQMHEHSGRGKDLKQKQERSEHGKDLKQMHEHSEHGKESKRQKSLSGHSIPRSPSRTHIGRSLEMLHQYGEDHKVSTGKRHYKKASPGEGQAFIKRHKKIEVLSRDDRVHAARRFKRESINSFRRPRDFQFVTNKMDRLPIPPIVRVYPPGQRDEREIDRGYRKAQRRIIYYANLPEIVRPPVQWYPNNDYFYDSSRQPYTSASTTIYSPSKSSYPSYPSASDNDITRVQSNILDVTKSRFPSYSSSSPKFTIIDVEPPYYNRPPLRYDPPNRFYDIRTPPYRDYSHFPSQSFHSDTTLEPVKLQTPPPDYSSTSNSTESSTNSTRFLPDVLPVNLRSISKFIT